MNAIGQSLYRGKSLREFTDQHILEADEQIILAVCLQIQIADDQLPRSVRILRHAYRQQNDVKRRNLLSNWADVKGYAKKIYLSACDLWFGHAMRRAGCPYFKTHMVNCFG